MTKFVRKVNAGEIELPLTRADRSQKSAKDVRLQG
nr:pyocin activator PrtN family protein [Oricola cellulosilytica]